MFFPSKLCLLLVFLDYHSCCLYSGTVLLYRKWTSYASLDHIFLDSAKLVMSHLTTIIVTIVNICHTKMEYILIRIQQRVILKPSPSFSINGRKNFEGSHIDDRLSRTYCCYSQNPKKSKDLTWVCTTLPHLWHIAVLYLKISPPLKILWCMKCCLHSSSSTEKAHIFDGTIFDASNTFRNWKQSIIENR